MAKKKKSGGPTARERLLIEAGQAALDWAIDTDSCHFCSYDGHNIPHGTAEDNGEDCPVKVLHEQHRAVVRGLAQGVKGALERVQGTGWGHQTEVRRG